MRVFFLVWAVLVVLLGVGPAFAAPQVKISDCEDLTAWAGKVNVQETFDVAPRLTLPKAFHDKELGQVFGVVALAWTQEDFQASNQAMTSCY